MLTLLAANGILQGLETKTQEWVGKAIGVGLMVGFYLGLKSDSAESFSTEENEMCPECDRAKVVLKSNRYLVCPLCDWISDEQVPCPHKDITYEDIDHTGEYQEGVMLYVKCNDCFADGQGFAQLEWDDTGFGAETMEGLDLALGAESDDLRIVNVGVSVVTPDGFSDSDVEELVNSSMYDGKDVFRDNIRDWNDEMLWVTKLHGFEELERRLKEYDRGYLFAESFSAQEYGTNCNTCGGFLRECIGYVDGEPCNQAGSEPRLCTKCEDDIRCSSCSKLYFHYEGADPHCDVCDQIIGYDPSSNLSYSHKRWCKWDAGYGQTAGTCQTCWSEPWMWSNDFGYLFFDEDSSHYDSDLTMMCLHCMEEDEPEAYEELINQLPKKEPKKKWWKFWDAESFEAEKKRKKWTHRKWFINQKEGDEYYYEDDAVKYLAKRYGKWALDIKPRYKNRYLQEMWDDLGLTGWQKSSVVIDAAIAQDKLQYLRIRDEQGQGTETRPRVIKKIMQEWDKEAESFNSEQGNEVVGFCKNEDGFCFNNVRTYVCDKCNHCYVGCEDKQGDIPNSGCKCLCEPVGEYSSWYPSPMLAELMGWK